LAGETYEVVTKGKLSPALVNALDGYFVARFDRGFSHLVGVCPDQERLHGLLRLLRDMNIELLSINTVLR
jgi:hypothetical protein